MPRPARRPSLVIALALVLACACALAASSASAATVHDVPLPSGSRSVSTDVFVSGQTFRKSVDHIARWLIKSGLAHEAVPVYRYRGVDVARFLSAQESTPWLAIHIYRRQGKTMISIIPRPAPPPP